jgi:hypothetical protein
MYELMSILRHLTEDAVATSSYCKGTTHCPKHMDAS